MSSEVNTFEYSITPTGSDVNFKNPEERNIYYSIIIKINHVIHQIEVEDFMSVSSIGNHQKRLTSTTYETRNWDRQDNEIIHKFEYLDDKYSFDGTIIEDPNGAKSLKTLMDTLENLYENYGAEVKWTNNNDNNDNNEMK